MTPRDRQRFADMLAHARSAVRYMAGYDAGRLAADGLTRGAVLWNVSIAGEAASKLSDAAREALSDLPLAEARRMRNMLIHGYPEVDLDLLVQTVTNDLPTLIARLEALLGEPPQ